MASKCVRPFDISLARMLLLVLVPFDHTQLTRRKGVMNKIKSGANNEHDQLGMLTV